MTRNSTRTSGSSDPLAANFAARFREAQEHLDIKNEQLARELGVSLRLVQKWRSGEVRPGGVNLVKIARLFDRDVSWFFSNAEVTA